MLVNQFSSYQEKKKERKGSINVYSLHLSNWCYRHLVHRSPFRVAFQEFVIDGQLLSGKGVLSLT